MRKLLLISVLAATMPAAANAATWVATCSDGKDIQYIQTENGQGFLYLKADKDLYQTARLSQTSYDGSEICGTVRNNVSTGAEPVTQICASKDRQIIYLKYKNPTATAIAAHDVGRFCTATVVTRATNLKDQ